MEVSSKQTMRWRRCDGEMEKVFVDLTGPQQIQGLAALAARRHGHCPVRPASPPIRGNGAPPQKAAEPAAHHVHAPFDCLHHFVPQSVIPRSGLVPRRREPRRGHQHAAGHPPDITLRQPEPAAILLMASKKVLANWPAEMSHSPHGECDFDSQRTGKTPSSQQLAGRPNHLGPGG